MLEKAGMRWNKKEKRKKQLPKRRASCCSSSTTATRLWKPGHLLYEPFVPGSPFLCGCLGSSGNFRSCFPILRDAWFDSGYMYLRQSRRPLDFVLVSHVKVDLGF